MLGYGIDTVFDAAALNERCGRIFREVSCTLGDAVVFSLGANSYIEEEDMKCDTAE